MQYIRDWSYPVGLMVIWTFATSYTLALALA
jgi:hypothetical protein